MKNKNITSLTLWARELYGHLKIRYEYSIKNNFKDKDGVICIIFPYEELMKRLNISKPTVIKYLKELEDKNYISKKRLGRGKPNIIYLNENNSLNQIYYNNYNYYTQNEISENQVNMPEVNEYPSSKNYEVKKDITKNIEQKDNKKSLGEEVVKKMKIDKNKEIAKKFPENEIKQENKENSKKQNSLYYKNKNLKTEIKEKYVDIQIKQLKKNINYDELKSMDEFKDNTIIEDYIDIIRNSLFKNSVRVNKCFISLDTFINRILTLDKNHILYVHECISTVKQKIMNIPAYILTSIFNSISTYNTYTINKNTKYDNLYNRTYEKKLTWLNTPTYTGEELEAIILANNGLDDF